MAQQGKEEILNSCILLFEGIIVRVNRVECRSYKDRDKKRNIKEKLWFGVVYIFRK